MIGFLEGEVAGRTPEGCLLDVGGVGYLLHCPPRTVAALPPEGRRVRLHTHLHVREDVLALYGFASDADRRAFLALTTVSGVGPKVALQVVSAFPADALHKVVATRDAKVLASVPGIGTKTAQRIVLELAGKLGAPESDAANGAAGAARAALENLGYSVPEIHAALAHVGAGPEEDVPVGEVVRQALRVLAR